MRNALHATLAQALGLRSRDLAEIGGFSERFARDLLAGARPFPADTAAAIDQIDDDCDVMTAAMVEDIKEGAGALFVFKTNEQLRKCFSQWPGRGHASGGFVGPHRIAALAAREILDGDGFEVEIYFEEHH